MSRRRPLLILAVGIVAITSCGQHDSGASAENPFTGARLYVDPQSSAARAAAALRASHPQDAAEIDKIAKHAQAEWFGDWDSPETLRQSVGARVRRMRATRALPVFVIYNLPLRDCHGYSGGGAASPRAYRSWIREFVSGVGGSPAAIIVEPDALAQLGCLTAAQRSVRLGLLRYAVRTLTARPRIAVYLDAGHRGWVAATTMGNRLRAAGVEDSRGFALNVSNYGSTSGEQAYGHQISSEVGDKPFVIDTSRNGLGSNGEWCNARNRALGHPPTGATGDPTTDAYLWIKPPGESDGPCNGGPAAGRWWLAYAIGLAQRARW